MAIRPYEVQVATNPVGRTSSQFSTNMPEPDLRGVQRLAGVIGDIGEQQMKDAATKEAELAASTITVKNPDGSYARIDKPEGFGSYAESVFNQAVEKKYVNEVYRDSETTLNDIATNPSLSAEQSVFQMRAHVDAVIANVDPKYKDQVANDLLREFNQRAFGIKNLYKSQSVAAMTLSFQDFAEKNLNQAIDYYNSDNPTLAAEMMVKATSNFQSFYELSLKDPTLVAQKMEELKSKVSGIEWFAGVLKKVRQKVDDGTIPPDELNNLARLMSVGSTPTNTYAAGVIESDIVEKLHPDVRAMFGKMLGAMSSDYSQKFSINQSETTIRRVAESAANGTFSKLAFWDASEEDITKGVLRFAVNNNLSVLSPAGAVAIANQLNGFLPKKIYQGAFDNLSIMDPSNKDDMAALQSNLDLFNQLKVIPLKTGNVAADLTDVLDAKTRAMMQVISDQTAIGRPIDVAYKAAKYQNDSYTGEDVSTRRSRVYNETGLTNSFAVVKDVLGTEVMGVTTLTSTVPSNASDSIMDDIAYSLHMGVSIDQAKIIAKTNFEKRWKVDDKVFSGSSFTENPLPLVASAFDDPTPTNDYIVPYVDQIINQVVDWNVMRQNEFNTPKDQLILGKTLKLVPEGSQQVVDKNGLKGGVYSLQYMGDDGIGRPLLGANGVKVLIVPAKAAELYRQHNVAVDAYVAIERAAGRNPIPSSLVRSIQSNLYSIAENTVGQVIKTFEPNVQTRSFEDTYDPETIFKPDYNDILPSDAVNESTGRISIPTTAQAGYDYAVKEGWIDALTAEADRLGISEYNTGMINMIGYESKWVVGIKNKKSSARGLGQMTDGTWELYKRNPDGTIMERTPRNELIATVRYVADIKKTYKRTFNKNPEMGEVYALYNQGEGGGIALMLADPNKSAVSVLAPFYDDITDARDAVMNNLPDSQKNINITAGQLLISLKSRVKG